MRHLPLRYALIWHDYLLLWILGTLAAFWPAPAAVGSLMLFLVDRRLWTTSRLALCFCVFLAGFSWTSLALARVEAAAAAKPAWLASNDNQIICGEITRVQGLPERRLRILLSGLYPQNSPDAPALPGLCAWSWDEPLIRPAPGQSVCINRPIKRQDGFANGDYGYKASFVAQNVNWRIWSKGNTGNPQFAGSPVWGAALRNNLETAFLSIISPESGEKLPQSKAILMALLFGDRQWLNQTTVNSFAAATLAHSLALSGQHLCVAGFIGFICVLLAGHFWPSIYLARPRGALIAMASLGPALLYLWLGNAPPSLIRAAAMLGIFSLWIWQFRAFGGFDLLCCALLLILVFHPLALFDIGLQMSALCILVLTLAAPAFAKLWRALPLPETFWGRLGEMMLKIIAASLAIQFALLPLSLSRFQLCGFWFPLNALWLPALGFAVLPLAAAALCLSLVPLTTFKLIAEVLADAAAMPCDWLLSLLDWLASKNLLREPVFMAPHWSAILAYAAIIGAIAWFFGARSFAKGRAQSLRLLVMALILLAVAPALRLASFFDKTITLEALDVGQGQALSLSFPGHGRLILDAGGVNSPRFDPGQAILAPILASNRNPRISALVNSHPDLDHLGGMFYLAHNFNPNGFFHNGREPSPVLKSKWNQLPVPTTPLAAGDKIILGAPDLGLVLEVLHPPREFANAWQGNAASLVLRLARNGDGLILFTGDGEKETLDNLLESGQDLSALALIMPHHGSNRSFAPEFYQAVNPALGIANCGLENHWKYPGDKITALFTEKGIPLLDTGKHGRITLNLGRNITLTTAKGKAPEFSFDRWDKTR